MIRNLAAAWCAEAVKLLAQSREALIALYARQEEVNDALRATVAETEADPALGDGRLVRQGAAATLRAFEQMVLDWVSFTSFPQYEQIQQARKDFGSTQEREPGPKSASEKLAPAIEALNAEIDSLQAEAGGQAASSQVQGLPAILSAMTRTPPSVSPRRTEWPLFYVPQDKRNDRIKAAAWTIGVLFLLSLLFHLAILWSALVIAAGCFGAQVVVTNQIDEEDRSADRNLADYEEQLKNRIMDLDARARGLLDATLGEMAFRLEEVAMRATEACREMLSIARGAKHAEPSPADLVFGECVVPLLFSYVEEKDGVEFRDYATANPGHGRFAAQREPLAGCLAYTPIGECDAIEIHVEPDIDPGAIGTAMATATLRALEPGRTRFMFIEPGRLAEAYRVFGALNESAATRLAERLYVTHVSELGDAVDALRTFVGRTKEAMTRRADGNRRISESGAEEGAILLQRAVVLIDETQSLHWPEKDRRRLAEYFGEVKALARVGASEGSILLIELREGLPTELKGDLAAPAARCVRLQASAKGLTFANGILALHPAPESTAAIGAECDIWVKAAKKADSSLRQTGAALDWSDAEASDTRHGIEIDIGRHGADRPARLLLGREGAHHAICIGRTGSGKTNLFHVIISNLVRRYSPDELELYLLDFKEGVEFAVYADLALPHCRAVAIDADRGFGLSVLTHLKRELNRRASIFKAAGVGIASLERYEIATGKNMPRIVLLIDEFQVLLQAGERMAGAAPGAAAAALEDLVRRGRSFGLHVILGSQTLAGRELTAAALGQLAVRIVLPCSAADAAMLLGEQPISSQLRAPGDAIVWRAGLGDISDAHLAKIFEADLDDLPALAEMSRTLAATEGKPALAPYVFRGSGQNELGEVMPHLEATRRERNEPDASFFAVGAPTSYGDRPAGLLRNARARNLLFVHRAEETRADFLYSALESLLLLDPACSVTVCDLDQSKDISGDRISERLQTAFGERVLLIDPRDLEAEIGALAEARRQSTKGSRAVLAIAGSARVNLARSPAFAALLRDGPEAGLHVFATCDTAKNLERLIDRSMLSEFGIRALGPASAGDSQRLLEANDAEGLSADHHYLLFDDSAVGRLARLQVLTPSLERGETVLVRVAEVIDV